MGIDLNLILRKEGDNKMEKCPLCGGEKNKIILFIV